MRYLLLFSIFKLIFILTAYSQNIDHKPDYVKGLVLDSNTHTALSYTNIVVLHRSSGTISNEKGFFLLDISELDLADTLSFQYVGYKVKNIAISDLDSLNDIYLTEEIINLSETFVFGDPPDPEVIIESVLEHKASNYKKRTAKNQVFIRKRYISDIENINIKLKRNSIPGLDKKLLKLIERKLPKHNTSYTDFLGNIYFSKNLDDSIKVDPTRTVSLKEKEISEFKKLETLFENLLKNTKEEEYWKVKSGIIGQKIDIKDDKEKKDSLDNIEADKNSRKTSYYNWSIKHDFEYSLLDDKSEWEFLYSTGKYEYTLTGGTRVNGEDVYIIDFTPKRGGKYIGRVYISINTKALIRADYEYAVGKHGTNFQLLGIGYTENHFKASIFFEKKGDSYTLKYLSYKSKNRFSFDRHVSMLKKRERFLIDKKLFEIKIKFSLAVNSEESTEILILDNKAINEQQFSSFKQKDKMKVIYVDKFSDELWKGFPIIEPIQRMREYEKQE